MKKLLFLLMVSLLMSGSALAASVTVSPQNAEDVFEWVYFSYDATGDGQFDDDIWTNWRTEKLFSTYAGRFELTLNDDSGASLYTTYGFCVDLSTGYGSDTYSVADLNSINNGDQIAWLFDNFGQSGKTLVEYAALQLAIWDTLYDEAVVYNADHWTKEGFMAPDVSYETLYDLYELYIYELSQTPDYTTTGTYQILQIEGKQDMIVHVVPAPSTILLLGFGLLSLSFAGRTKRI